MMASTLDHELRRKADCYLDKHHEEFAQLGKQLFKSFGYDKSHARGRISTQIRNLQQIAGSARRFVDIEDFVKNQMGKGTDKWPEVGRAVLAQLRRLRDESRKTGTDDQQQFSLRLYYARGWVRAVVSEYLYQVAEDQMENTKHGGT